MEDQQMGGQAPQVTDLNIERVFQHAVRFEEIFQAARQHLLPSHFCEAGEAHYRVLWQEILRYYEDHTKLPVDDSLSVRVLDVLKDEPGVTQPTYDAASAILRWMFDEQETPSASLDTKDAMMALRALLTDRAAGKQIRQAAAVAMGGEIPNLPQLLKRTKEKIDEFSMLGKEDDDLYSSRPKLGIYAKANAPARPTGVVFIDKYLGGGSKQGDVNVLIGPTGVGKTLLATQMAVAMAKMQHQLVLRGEGKPGFVAFVSYETGQHEWQLRAASYGARIHLGRLKFLTDQSVLSTTGNLQDYELSMYRAQNKTEDLLGEQERLAELDWMDTYLKFIDFSPAETSYGGRGGVAEIRQHLMAIERKLDMPCYSVLLDWAGAMAENKLLAEGKDMSGGALSLELGVVCSQVHKEITGPMGCTAWVAHQLKSSLCKRSPTVSVHHSEAAWCAGFSNRAWYSFGLGTKDEEHNLCQLSCSKTRSGEPMPPIICRINGAFGELQDASQQFAVDTVGHRLAPQGDMDRLHPSVATSSRSRTVDTDLDV